MTTLGALLSVRAAEHPDRPALVMPDGTGWTTWTFRDLDDASHRMAISLAGHGVRTGDRVLMLCRPSPRFYATVFALGRIGAAPVLVDPGMGRQALLSCIEQIAPRVVIALPAVHAVRVLMARRAFRAAKLMITDGTRWFWGGPTLEGCLAAQPAGARFDGPPPASSDLAAIVFTSGSTGTPKGVRFEHGMFVGATRALASLGLGPGRVTLETFAAFVLVDVALGMTAVVPDMDLSRPAKADPARLLAAITSHRPDTAFASPVVLRKIVERAKSTDTILPFRTVLSGVAPVPGQLHADLREVAPDATLIVNYGATEALTVTWTDSAAVLGETWGRARAGDGTCVGRAFPDGAFRVVPLAEPAVLVSTEAVPNGEIGEILVSGPVVSPSYVGRPDADKTTKIHDGTNLWHRTGDVGWRDDDGRLWYAGRSAHVVKTAEGPLPSVPVEGVFDDHPGVKWTGLVAVDGEPVICVEALPGASIELDALLGRADTTRWRGRVRAAVLVPEFPVDARHNAKIRREALAAAAGERRAAIRRRP